MFAKIKNWQVMFLSEFKQDKTMIKLTQKDHNIIQQWWEYINGKFIQQPIIQSKQNKIDLINQEFNNKIFSYNSKYPIEEQKRFSDKLQKAEKVIAWGTDPYIKAKALKLKITPLEFAKLIKVKADEFEAFYLKTENDRDDKLSLLI